MVTVHGGGIFASPERFETVYRADVNRSNTEGYTGEYAAKISVQEARDVLDGRLPSGDEIPVYPFEELKAWNSRSTQTVRGRHGFGNRAEFDKRLRPI